ncbi:MAG: SGNH/GDSL hydrolase family protein [Verrucomicrobiota bacterium]
MRRFFPLLGLIGLVVGGLRAAPGLPPEASPRNGWPHVAARLVAGREITVAFLGGSITAAHGWRPGILDHLRTAYPKSRFTELVAAVPGTGSDYGAARLRAEVLGHEPDLLFVEFAVNDTGRDPVSIARSMEGIVRQTRRLSPRTDLAFVYTLSAAGLPELDGAGRFPPPAIAMEKVARHYDVPTVHLGVEVVRRLRAGTLTFAGDEPAANTILFTHDKIHPTDAGHRIYTEVLARHVLAAGSASATPALPAPLDPLHHEGARLVPLAEIAGADDLAAWRLIAGDDPRLHPVSAARRRPTWFAERPGRVLGFSFEGSGFGFVGLKGPDAGRFRVVVDDRAPVEATLFDDFCVAGRYRIRPWFYPAELAPGRHTVRIELLAEGPDKSSVRRRSAPAGDPAFDRHVLTLSELIIVGPPDEAEPAFTPTPPHETPPPPLRPPPARTTARPPHGRSGRGGHPSRLGILRLSRRRHRRHPLHQQRHRGRPTG